MNATRTQAKRWSWRWAALAVMALIAAGIALFQWNWLRGPIGSAVQDKTGRPFVIAGDLDVGLFRGPLIRMKDVRFENPPWARDPHLITAREAEFTIDFGALTAGKLVFPYVRLSDPEISLERAPDGQRNWILKVADDGTASAPEVRQLSIDHGVLRYRDAVEQVEMNAQVSTSTDAARSERPTTVEFSGTYKKVPMKGEAHTAPVLNLRNTDEAFSMWLRLTAGQTLFEADGDFTDLAHFSKIDARFKIRGPDWARLYPIIPLPLPTSPPYSFDGRLKRAGNETTYENFSGRVGGSDLAGSGTYLSRTPRPFLKANLHSRVLDLKDLGPIVGARPQMTQPAKSPAVTGRVLPTEPFQLERLNSMDAEVTLKAGQLRRPNQLPLDDLQTHLYLANGVLKLNPLRFGIASGALDSTVTLDAHQDPIRTKADVRLKNARINQLFPTVKLMKDSDGVIGASVQLSGSGNSVAAMLGSASGELGVAMTGGELSNLMIELVGLDGGEALKFLIGGDRKTPIRCAVGSFQVRNGVATSNSLVLDTEDTNIAGAGTLNLRSETLDITLRPEPKDKSIFVVRSPIRLHGPFADPDVSVNKGPIIARAGASILLGLVNPLAALIPLIETGPGKDSDCKTLLASVDKARVAAATPARNRVPAKSSRRAG
ncbi:MAG TPA: AsmA family protein [Burkholderiales bacterium]|nr:AsmA family protein [Burkholderiales bacterium]